MNSVTLCDHLSPGNPPLTADAAEEKGGFSFWLCGLLLGWFLWYKVTCSMWGAQGHSRSGLPFMAPALIHLAHPKRGLSVALACISLPSSLRPETRHFWSRQSSKPLCYSVGSIATFFNQVWLLSWGMLLPNFFLPWSVFLHCRVFLSLLVRLFTGANTPQVIANSLSVSCSTRLSLDWLDTHPW